MLDGILNISTKIYFGRDSLNYLVHEIVKNSSGRNILLVYGKDSIKQYGIYDKVTNILKEIFVNYFEINGVRSNPTMDKVEEGIEICREHQIDFILAVGGGSVIDTAKMIIYYCQDLKIKLGTILTIPGSGSECNASAMITDESKKEKIGYTHECMRPTFSILNPEFTMSLNLQQTACGILDAITHILERYFSKTNNVVCTTELCMSLLTTLIYYYNKIIEESNNYDYRAEIMYACMLAHNNIVGFGRKQDWASHNISHEISALYPNVSHGNLVFIIMMSWIKYVEKESFEEFIPLLKYKGIFENLFEIDLGMDDKFEEIADKCCSRTKSGTVGNYVRLNKNDIVNILNIAYKGDYVN
jgi:alcohol dehydrogenase